MTDAMLRKGHADAGTGADSPPAGRVDLSARWRGIDVQACHRYILSRQTPEGGFCFYAYRPWGVGEPNAPDTCAAVAILDLLQQPVPERERCVEWLYSLQDARGGYGTLVIAHAALKALQKLGAAPARDCRAFLRRISGILGLGDADGRTPARELTAALKCVELWRDYGLAATDTMRARVAEMLGQQRAENGGYGAAGPSLPETAAATALARMLDIPIDAQGVLRYVRQCEGPPYGVNVAPSATSSDLESQRAALWLLRHHGARPRHAALVGKHVAMCQEAPGGFGRSPGAIARLGDTLCALEILSWLAETEPDQVACVG